MIDLEKELRDLAVNFNVPDKEVVKWWRDGVRGMWGDSIFKRKFLKDNVIMIENTNPRSMKRFPIVAKYKCAICGEYFGGNDIEIDHIEDENTLKEYHDVIPFVKSIMFTSPDKLQILCKDRKSKAKDTKNHILRFGCHGIKTYSSRYGVSFEEARKEKEYLNIIKFPSILLDKLGELGIESIPKTKVDKERLLRKILFKDEGQ